MRLRFLRGPRGPKGLSASTSAEVQAAVLATQTLPDVTKKLPLIDLATVSASQVLPITTRGAYVFATPAVANIVLTLPTATQADFIVVRNMSSTNSMTVRHATTTSQTVTIPVSTTATLMFYNGTWIKL